MHIAWTEALIGFTCGLPALAILTHPTAWLRGDHNTSKDR